MNNVSAWSWAAALAALMAMVPAEAARAGADGLVAPLLALPVVFGVERLLGRLACAGLAAGFRRVLGPRTGRVLTIIYMVWAAVLGGVLLKGSAHRLELGGATVGGSWVLIPALVLLAVWFVRGKRDFCAGWAVIVWKGLLAVLAALTVLALMQVRWENLLPLRLGSGGLLRATSVALGALCVRVYSGFLRGEADDRARPWYPLAVCGLVSLLLAAVQGALGAQLASRLEEPLLTLSRNVGLEGVFRRMESVLAAVLLAADLALLTLLLWAARRGAEQAWKPRCGRVAVLLVAAGVLGCGLWPVDKALVRTFRQNVVPGVNLIFGLVIPLALGILDRWKSKKERAYLVAKKEENGTY